MQVIDWGILRSKLKIVTLSVVTVWSAVCGLTAQGERPNIVYFFADDLGWAGIRANQQIAAERGVDITEISKVITPHIDKLVAGGINFTHAYGSTVCSPSRSCQQTGFHQGHTWADRNDPSDDKAMRTQDPTLGKLMASAGYRNGMYGKWGYGATRDIDNPKIVNQQTLPIEHGYHDCVVELHHIRAHTFLQPTLWYSHVDEGGTISVPTMLKENKKEFPGVDLYADNYYAAGAIRFIREEVKTENPFFVQISFQVPHAPFDEIETIPGWFNDYKNVDTSTWSAEVKQYAAMMTLMDKRIGDVIAALKDPNQDGDESDSVMGNTLLLFSSDNGGAECEALKFFNGNGHLTGFKRDVIEGGIRDPLAFYWEGVIEPGQSTRHKTCITDILPTFCELAGVDGPVGLDGTSIAPLLTGNGNTRKRPYFCYEGHSKKDSWWSLIRDNMKLVKVRGELGLYDLDQDESEQHNLIGNPELKNDLEELLQIAKDEKLEAENLYANVFPTWIGKDQSDINNAENWQETGVWEFEKKWPHSPIPSGNWITQVVNRTGQNQTSHLYTTIETLGFDVAGNPENGALMELKIDKGISLTGRNEIRISSNAAIQMNASTLSSVRWVDVKKNGKLAGSGIVDCDLYLEGTLVPQLSERVPIMVKGTAHLGGNLDVVIPKYLQLRKGDRVSVLSANSIQGGFKNEHVIQGKHKFLVRYFSGRVELEKI